MEKEFKEEMLEFKQEMTEFKGEMTEFKQEMTEFKEEMLEFKAHSEEKFKQNDAFQQEMTEFKQEMTEFKEEMLEFKKETKEALCSLTHAVNEIHNFLVVMEHNMTEKIDTLFSAYSVNQDQHEEFNNRLNDSTTRIDRHSFRITALENKTNLHSEQLSKLNS